MRKRSDTFPYDNKILGETSLNIRKYILDHKIKKQITTEKLFQNSNNNILKLYVALKGMEIFNNIHKLKLKQKQTPKKNNYKLIKMVLINKCNMDFLDEIKCKQKLYYKIKKYKKYNLIYFYEKIKN